MNILCCACQRIILGRRQAWLVTRDGRSMAKCWCAFDLRARFPTVLSYLCSPALSSWLGNAAMISPAAHGRGLVDDQQAITI